MTKFASRLKVVASALSATTIAPGVVITMGAAFAANCRTLLQAITDGAADPLAIKVGDQNVIFCLDDGATWVDVYGTITSNTQITVTQIISGSSGTGSVTFAGALPAVWCSLTGDFLRHLPVDSFPASFATSVPLAQIGTAHMPRYTVTGNMTLTPAAYAVRGAMAEYLFIMDGASALTFQGFTEHGVSTGIVNAAGMPNTVWFWYDGCVYWWSGSQAAVQTTMTGAAVANATPATVTLTASEALDTNYQPAASAFTVSGGHTVLAVSGMTSTTVNLSVSPPLASGETVTASYTQPATNQLRNLAGNLMASFSALGITDNVVSTATAVRLSLSSSSTVVGTAVTVTVGVDNPLTGSQSESVTLTAPVAGTWSANPVTLNASTQAATPTFTPSATGSGNITAASSGTPTLTDASIAYSATATPTEALHIDTISQPQTVGVAFPFSGTWTVSQPANLDYRLSDDPAGQWTALTATINSNGTWSASQTPTTANAGGRTISVRDRVNTDVTATSNSYVVNAAAAGSYPTFTSFSSSDSQSGSGPYTITGSGVGTGSGGVNDIATEKGGLSTLAATGDFTFDWKVLVAGAEVGLGLRSVQSTNTMSNLTGAYWFAGGSGTVPASLKRTGGSTVTFTPAAADVYRYSRVGSTVTLSVQRNGAGAFTVVDTLTGITTAKVWIDFICCGTSSAQLLACTGLA